MDGGVGERAISHLHLTEEDGRGLQRPATLPELVCGLHVVVSVLLDRADWGISTGQGSMDLPSTWSPEPQQAFETGHVL
jgi:hypothetical protein